MIANPFTYHAPESLEEVFSMLEDGSGKILAGGMSLIPLMKLRLASPESVIDLRRVPGLKEITESAGVVRVGAMATHHEVEISPVIRGKCPLLGEAAGQIGDTQVRNVGTIGGSVAHADLRRIIRGRSWRWRRGSVCGARRASAWWKRASFSWTHSPLRWRRAKS